MLVYDHFDHHEFPDRDFEFIPKWIPEGIRRNGATKEYAYRAKNILRHVGYQARGQASGVHGLLHQYVRSSQDKTPRILSRARSRFRIDAITLFAVPAHGPHGFHAIGR